MADEQFHEFHLDGKQMVFLFMATTVVAVVIFLCGVMVGRGVRANRVEPVVLAAPAEEETSALDPPEAVDVDPEALPPDELRYSARLQGTSPVPEPIRQAPPRAASEAIATSPVEEPLPAPKPETRAKPDDRTKADDATPNEFAEPAGRGYALQVSSLPKEIDAKDVGRSLKVKKYPVFITHTAGVPKFYRVRVGKYPTEKEARAVLARLKKTEGFRDAYLVPR